MECSSMSRTRLSSIPINDIYRINNRIFCLCCFSNYPWDVLSCEEMFEFAISLEHQEITMEQDIEFHKQYDPCLEEPWHFREITNYFIKSK